MGVCFLISNSLIAQRNIKNLSPDDIIYWSENKRLKLGDFKGRDVKDVYNRAVTRGGISTTSDISGDTLIVTSRSMFNRTQSAVKPGFETFAILEHEQLHFDILELFSRKLKKAISDHGPYKYSEARYAVEKLKIEINQIMRDTQSLYDEEATPSRDKQREWLNKIAVELQSLKAFRDPVVRVLLTH